MIYFEYCFVYGGGIWRVCYVCFVCLLYFVVLNKLFELFFKLNFCIYWFSLVFNINISKDIDGKNIFYGIMKLIFVLIIYKIIDFIIM